MLQACGVPCGPVNGIDEAIGLATRLGLAPVVKMAGSEGDVSTLTNPIGLQRSGIRYHHAPPNLGADNREVRAWLQDDSAGPLEPN